jgi:hypothetical protein
MSFSAIGTPCSGPFQPPSAMARSAATASARASAPVTVMKECRSPSTISMRVRQASTSSALLTFRSRIAAPASAMER